MHLTRHQPHHGLSLGEVGQHSPVGTRNIASLHGIAPQRGQLGLGSRFTELADRQFVAAVERLVQQLRGLIVLRHEAHRLVMQIVIRPIALGQTEASQRLAQFPCRETGADDGTVQSLAELPDLGPAVGLMAWAVSPAAAEAAPERRAGDRRIAVHRFE
jgi:hypothetical protein